MGEGPRPRARRPAPPGLSLPLPVAPAGPALATRLEPEEALPCEAPFDGEDWRFSIDWDGMRAILEIDPEGGVSVHDARLRDVAALLPEVVSAAPNALRGRSAVLDGVVALLDASGCPDLHGLSLRLAAPPAAAEPAPGLVFLATDLLCLDGASVLAWPFDRRQAALQSALTPAPHLQLPDWVPGHGVALADAARDRGLAAIVARHRDAPYGAGLASARRLRIEVEPRADAVVAAIVFGRRQRPAALLLAEFEQGGLQDSGRAAVDLDPAIAEWLGGRVEDLRTDEPPLTAQAQQREPGTVWVRPSLVATVRHNGRAADGRLRLPSVIALREDRPVRWCVRRVPRPVPAALAPAQGTFHPVVLTTLPFAESGTPARGVDS